MKARYITYPALFAALTVIGAQINIPIGEVPLTFQTLFVLLSGFILGARMGFLSQCIYLFMGALGFPVFAGFKGGLVHFFGPTGGYLIAFPISSFFVGLIAKQKNLINHFLASFIGILTIYLLGWLRLGLFMRDFKKAFEVGVAPFVLFDIIKIGIVVTIVERLEKVRKKITSL
ncbi:MAG TPA: biotin transporter BioY [Thermotoga sp.]|nr:biotin transporter BioY [Thermotoga sp.]